MKRPPIPRYLYVAACHSERDASAFHLLVTSGEEHDPDDEAGNVAIVRLLAQASERRDWFTTDDAYRWEVRRTAERIGAEIHELLRYSLPEMASAAGTWLPVTTDDHIWGTASQNQEE